MVQVTRREKESVTSLLRRFQRKIQQAGLIKEARRVRYHRKPPSPYKRRRSALRRHRIRELRDRLLKLGVITEKDDVPQQLKKKHAG